MIRIAGLAAVLILAAAGAAQAAAPSVIDRCTSQPGGDNNGSAAECIYLAADAEDARLIRAYKAALARLGPKGQKALQAEQRTWLKGRDVCPFSREADGADFVLLVANCVYEHNRDRADDLERR